MPPIKPFKEPIFVTRPFLPPLSEFSNGLAEIWDSQWLTNAGPILKRFENQLCDFEETSNLCIFNNGTLALQIGLQGLGISGEVITTPFTFVATTHALYWNKIRPVFCDIEPDHYTIDPDKIEELITPWTTAILAVHVFGHPCNLEKLEKIADKHNLTLIYDAAHAFGVRIDGQPIAHFGDLNMFSFHATKLFHSIEGGMLVFRDPKIKSTFNYLKNFGFKNEVEVVMPGTNAKMNEIQALMGIQVLQNIKKIIERKKEISDIYRQRLQNVPGIKFCPPLNNNIDYNYAYVPIEIHETDFGLNRDEVYTKLKEFNIYARRYFYPLIPEYACYKNISINSPLTVAQRVAENILTLPTYYDLKNEEVHKICDVLLYIHEN